MNEIFTKYIHVMAPNSTIYIICNLIALFTNILLLLIVPMIGALNLDLPHKLEGIFNIIIIADILVKLNVGFFTADGMIEMDRLKICKHYLNLQIWIDIISIVSYSTIIS